MTHGEKIDLLKTNPLAPCCLADYYSDLLNKIGSVNRYYGDYLITRPINCDEELKRVPMADYDLCCALLTMLLREDHFAQYGCFERRYESGVVQSIIDRMVFLLEREL